MLSGWKEELDMRWITHVSARCLLVAFLALPATAGNRPEIISCQKIWDAAPHNAFTSLVWFRDQWFCAFREGAGHVSPDGAIRILRSGDGSTWQSAARITMDKADLRDLGLAVTANNQLALVAAAAWHKPIQNKDGTKETHQTFFWTSPDGETWTDATPVGDPNYWIWKLTYFGPDIWGMGYATGHAVDQPLRLYGGKHLAELKKITEIPAPEPGAWLTESSLTFGPDGTMYCLQRRDPHTAQGLLGIAHPPYTQWTWKPLRVGIGGPALVRLQDGRLVGIVRLYDPIRTGVGEINPETGTFTSWLTLPSGGDCSYAGVVEWDGLLWISYYSSHEGKTSIYFAKVTLTPADPEKPGQ